MGISRRPIRGAPGCELSLASELHSGLTGVRRVPILKVIWEDEALKLLEARDRYTRNAIREGFSENPEKAAILFDRAQGGFLTPVSHARYSVVWYLDVDRQQAVVRAVVPLTNLTAVDDTDELKKYVQRAVQAESNGEIVVS